MKYEPNEHGMCTNCKHWGKNACICRRVPEGGQLVFGFGGPAATGWTQPAQVTPYEQMAGRADRKVPGATADRGKAPELAAPYGVASADPVRWVPARWLADLADGPVRDAYEAGVAAAREAIAAAKYDAERDHREWSVREVEVPPWPGATRP